MKILFIGPIGDFEVVDGGYGNAATGIAFVLQNMLKNKKIDELKIVSTLKINVNITLNNNYDVAILVTHPDSFKDESISNYFFDLLMCARKRYISIVWETNPLPKSWGWLWNDDIISGFVTPSYFIGNQIKEKTNKPVYYYPHFINTKLFKTIDIKNKINEKMFTVLIIGQYTRRKNIEDSVICFLKALGKNEDCQLIIKYHEMSNVEFNFEQNLNYLIKSNIEKPKAKIYTLNEKLDSTKIVELYQNSSVLLFISRGEGFGLPPLESMSCGIPVIYSNSSALSEVAEYENNIAINGILDYVVNMQHYGYDYDSYYFYPSIKETCDALKQKYEEWKKDKKLYYNKSQKAKNIIELKFGLEAIENYLNNIFIEKNKL